MRGKCGVNFNRGGAVARFALTLAVRVAVSLRFWRRYFIAAERAAIAMSSST